MESSSTGICHFSCCDIVNGSVFLVYLSLPNGNSGMKIFKKEVKLLRLAVAIVLIPGTVFGTVLGMRWLENTFGRVDMIIIAMILMAIVSYAIRSIRK